MKPINLILFIIFLLSLFPSLTRAYQNTSYDRFTYSLELPASSSFNIDYDYPLFKITFSPSIKRPPSMPPTNSFIDRIQTELDNNGNIRGLTIYLKRQIQYLVSRENGKLQIIFISPSSHNKSITNRKNKKNILQNIKFTKDMYNTLYIKLKVNTKPNYEVQSQEKDTLSLLFPSLFIPSQLVRYYDLSEFKNNIKGVVLKNSPKGGKLSIIFLKRIPVAINFNQGYLVISLKGSKREVLVPGQNRGRNKTLSERTSPTSSMPWMSREEGVILPGMQKRFTGAPISIDLQNAEVAHVLRLLSDIGGYNLILDGGVKGTITLKLKNVPWDQVLDLVLMEKDLGMVKEGNILRIAPISKIQQEQDRIRLTKEKEKTLEPLITKYIKVNYTTAQNMASKLKEFLSKRGKISYDDRTNQLIISDTKENLKKIEGVLRRLDQPEKQVLIEARVVYARESFARDLGIKWGGGFQKPGHTYTVGLYGTGSAITAPTQVSPSAFAINLPSTLTPTMGIGGFISKIAGSNFFTLDAQLALGESEGKVKTISSPRIITLNNQEAEVIQGTKIATQSESPSGGTTTTYYDAALKLSVKPQITPDNHLILEIQISDDSPAEGENISTKSVTTKLMVKDGETVVIGGVQKLRKEKTSSRVPFLANIPILGNLFKNKYTSNSKEELLIFIRPKIL